MLQVFFSIKKIMEQVPLRYVLLLVICSLTYVIYVYNKYYHSTIIRHGFNTTTHFFKAVYTILHIYV
jgi:hypothetical protein